MSKAPAVKQRKTHKWADFQKEADVRSKDVEQPPQVDPFVIDDVEPPIIIEAPDEKTVLVISEQIGILFNDMIDPNASVQRLLPLLRAFCGDQFPRVWAMLPKKNTTQSCYVVMQALMDHFASQLTTLAAAREAAELPGGSKASSDS